MAGIQTGIELNDQFTGVLYGIINSVNLAVYSMQEMQSTMDTPMDGAMLDGAIEQINQATMLANEYQNTLDELRENVEKGISVPTVTPTGETSAPDINPVTWNTDGLEVFTSTGVERFQQEVQSANDMLNTLNQTQAQIEQTASTMDVLPDSAIQDINAIGQRIQAVQARITQIENNPINFGTDTANAELEQLRSQLNQAVEEQNALNDAIESMDVSAANDAYLRLSQTVSYTERYIRDNVDEQGRFNQEIRAGTSEANDLLDTIKGVVGAYVSIQAVGDVLNISDELASTTARLNLMNDELQSTQELQNMIYIAAQNSRGAFGEMSANVAQLGNLAGDAFSSSAEIVAFAEQLNKQLKLSGANTEMTNAAMLQLTQSLSKGVLNGDELTSVMENGSVVAQTIADYLGVTTGEMKQLAAEGVVTSDVIIAAVLGATDATNEAFASLPMTWADIWQSMQNSALAAFQPVLQKINDFANSNAVRSFVNGAIEAMAVLANVVLNVFDFMASCGQFVSDNWSIIEPIILGIAVAFGIYTAALVAHNAVQGVHNVQKAIATVQEYAHAKAILANAGAYSAETVATASATVAQASFNTALAACPLTWIILLIIALIAVIFAVCNAIADMTGVAESGFGVICGGVNVVIAFFKNLGLSIANIALGIGNAIAALGSNIMTAFHNAICSVQSWWYNLLATVLDVVAGICESLNKLPFVEFDYSGITSAADEYAAKASEAAGNKQDYQSISDAFNEGFSTFDTFQDGWVSDAFNAGASWGDGVADAVGNFSMSDLLGSTDIPNPDDYTSQFAGMSDSLDGISSDTGNISDALEVTEEELKYMRDIAEQEAVNRYTVAEVSVDMSGMQNTVNNGTDLDGFVSGLTDAVNEAVDSITEGVHE